MNLTIRQNAISLNTAAAAYAEVGRFDKAVEMASNALRLAQEEGQNDLASSIKTRLALYQQNKPFHGSL